VTLQVAVAGGGIGGLAAALASVRAGCHVRVLERTPAFSEIGAGIQLGPNVTRILHGWGLADQIKAVAAVPDLLRVRSAGAGEVLGALRLAASFSDRYGAPYVTMHRADLHGVLLAATSQHADVRLNADRPVESFAQTADAVTVRASSGPEIECDALIGADGLWSVVRQQLLDDGQPRLTGHLAYRALVAQADLPARFRSNDVTAWLGPRMHVVYYPVRGGDFLNVVAFVQGAPPTGQQAGGWDHYASAGDLIAAMGGVCSDLRSLVEAIADWRLWVMYDRPPIGGAHQHARGRVALLGDAAHPMRPYLAQGAGMAIEDAAELGNALAQAKSAAVDVATMLQRYALNRWQRNARVQARALRNGHIFHADGLLRWGRDASLKLLGERLLDMPWLYGAVPKAS
jgi:salicylate hydroxylase